jgi:nitrite reductase/ring-hydroxylating ferredoxin subunit
VDLNHRKLLIIVCDQQIFAIEDRCPQTGRSLAHGAVINFAITSPVNGARYSLKSGHYLGGGQSPLQSHWLTRFPVRVIGDSVFVRLPQR